MENYYIIDSHCDTLGKIADNGANLCQQEQSHITIDGLAKGRVGMQFFAAWVGPKTKYYPCLQRGLKLIDAYNTMLDTYSDIFMPVLDYSNIEKARQMNRIATLLTVEGGDVLEGEILNLRILYKLGVRGMTLTWNHRNELADGVMEKKSLGGLSIFGHEVIKEMNNIGMLVDVSHLSEKGFYDVLEISSKPFAATHSNAWTLCQHPRNLKDDQIKQIAERKGVIGINFYPNFLSTASASSTDIIRHIEYIASLAGIDVIGFGSDFDGIEKTPEDIGGPEGFDIIINKLLKLNYKEEEIAKIANGNYLRLLKDILEL